jgi:hypothetical protein
MRGRCKAPGLRLTDRPSGTNVPFAFTAPLGLVRPMARTHVRLLGPCFKTGRRDRRPTRDRDASRVSKHTRYTSRPKYPSPAETGARGLPPTRSNKLHPSPRSADKGSSRKAPEKCNLRQSRQRPGVLADHADPSRPDASLNLRCQLRESLRLPLHSFTYC